MKIRRLEPEDFAKAFALLRNSFANSGYESRLIENLHNNNKTLLEWICIHRNKAIAYICYSHAYKGKNVCGLHLGPLAVAPDMQYQGIGSELLRFSLRQPEVKEKTLYVLGNPKFYKKFGFEPCSSPICPFDKTGKHFLSIRNNAPNNFTVGYEQEFKKGL